VAIALTEHADELRTLDQLTPRQIVAFLDRHVIGQQKAKRAVAIALRNRIRRQRLEPELAAEVTPKNILLIGPTGVGKTEIARRLAQLAGSPFVKVEASKFTEVGYVGRDVESIVRDLAAAAAEKVRAELQEQVREKAKRSAEERLLDVLLPVPRHAEGAEPAEKAREAMKASREKLRAALRRGELEARSVEVEVREKPPLMLKALGGSEEFSAQLQDMLGGLMPGRGRRRAMSVAEAREVLQREEEARLVDEDEVARLARERAESTGIVFLDEIDKIAGREGRQGPDVSREGVQRDLLPIVEGTTVQTKIGPVRTDHVLFIAAGAFHVSKPSDLIPELQGRFPIRVELEALGEDELCRILTEPKGALLRQYQALLETEGVALELTPEAVRELARLAMEVNARTENIGARRLATLLEALLEEVSFAGPDGGPRTHRVDAADVRDKLAGLVRDTDQSRFIL
jgi:ATP-dependent HslUV protease ATP-binding subunit HslU